VAAPPEEDLFDLLSPAEFEAEVTELLLTHCGDLTGAQIRAVRPNLQDWAAAHGWVERPVGAKA
jgi:hypothetical protein